MLLEFLPPVRIRPVTPRLDIRIMNEYVNTIQPEIGEVWHADEMMVTFRGNWE